MDSFDVIIVGAGPAGLSAALILGRCRRRVLVCDAGNPRNVKSRALHAYLTRDGIEPNEFLRIARDRLRPYESEGRPWLGSGLFPDNLMRLFVFTQTLKRWVTN
jgi:thioredoxin reductase